MAEHENPKVTNPRWRAAHFVCMSTEQRRHQPEILAEFEAIVKTASLEG